MLKFDEQKQINSVNGGLALRGEIERVVDEIQEKGFDGIYFIGIGGTWASSLQADVYMRGRSALPVYVENAAEFITTGNKRFTKDSIVIFSSVTGNTEENRFLSRHFYESVLKSPRPCSPSDTFGFRDFTASPMAGNFTSIKPGRLKLPALCS